MYCDIYRVSLTLFKAVYYLLYFIPLRCEILCVVVSCGCSSLFSFIDNSVFSVFLDWTSVVYCRFKEYGKVGSSQLVSERGLVII